MNHTAQAYPHRRKNRIRDGSPLADDVICFFAAVLCFITLYPMYYILILSLSSPQAAATTKVYFVPDGFYLSCSETAKSGARTGTRSSTSPVRWRCVWFPAC